MYKDIFGDIRYKVGLHIHTTLSDGLVSPEKAAEIYRDAGYDAIAITDHWKYHAEGTLSGITIISGCEYNMGGLDSISDAMHIVGVGMTKDPCISSDSITRQGVIDAIKATDGLAILAHPAWSLNTPKEAAELSGFDAVEIYNTVSNVNQSSRPYSGYFTDLLANDGIIYPLVATDDAHYYNGEDETKSYIMVRAKSNSAEDILDAIRRRDFYSTQAPELHVRREGDKIIADCSNAVTIDFLTNTVWAADKMTRGKDLTHAEYTVKDFEKWVRVEVKDAEGRYAWSNIIRL